MITKRLLFVTVALALLILLTPGLESFASAHVNHATHTKQISPYFYAKAWSSMGHIHPIHPIQPHASPSPSPTPTPSTAPMTDPPIATPTEDPTPTPTPMATSSPTPVPTVEPIVTPTPTATPAPAPTPSPTPAPTPQPTQIPETVTPSYSYIMGISGSNYQVLNGANTVLYQSTSSSAVANYLLGPSGIANYGNTVYVKSGSYTVDSTWKIAVSGITITFQSGVMLTATSNHDAGNYGIQVTGNDVVLTGLTFNGNGLNQSPSPTTYITNNPYNQMYVGVDLAGNNDLIQDSTIYNWRCYAIETNGNNDGATGNLIYNIGANGITAATTATKSYFSNNEVYGIGDVGIDSYGWDTIITGNYVHDINSGSITMYGYVNSYWGIGIENGGGSGNGNYLLIDGNTISNTFTAISVTSGGQNGQTNINNIKISGNTINNVNWLGIQLFDSSYDIIAYNNFNGATYAIAATVRSGYCIGNNQYGNTYTGLSNGFIYPNGVTFDSYPP